MPLTPAERANLTALEHQLRADDPALAASLAQGPRPPRTLRPLGAPILRAREIALLLGALLVLAVLGPPVDDRFGALGLAVTTASLIVPWIIISARAGARRHDPVPATGQLAADDRDAPTK
jgi:hypothetical protein